MRSHHALLGMACLFTAALAGCASAADDDVEAGDQAVVSDDPSQRKAREDEERRAAELDREYTSIEGETLYVKRPIPLPASVERGDDFLTMKGKFTNSKGLAMEAVCKLIADGGSDVDRTIESDFSASGARILDRGMVVKLGGSASPYVGRLRFTKPQGFWIECSSGFDSVFQSITTLEKPYLNYAGLAAALGPYFEIQPARR